MSKWQQPKGRGTWAPEGRPACGDCAQRWAPQLSMLPSHRSHMRCQEPNSSYWRIPDNTGERTEREKFPLWSLTWWGPPRRNQRALVKHRGLAADQALPHRAHHNHQASEQLQGAALSPTAYWVLLYAEEQSLRAIFTRLPGADWVSLPHSCLQALRGFTLLLRVFHSPD